MTETKSAPATVAKLPISNIKCDLVAGPLRCIVRLAAGGPAAGIKAIWRNETGGAPVTGPRVRS